MSFKVVNNIWTTNTATLSFNLPKTLTVAWPSSPKVQEKPEPMRGEDIFRKHRAHETLVVYNRQGSYDGKMNKNVVISYVNTRELLARFFMTVQAQMGTIDNWRDFCVGICSGVLQSYLAPWAGHMPMLDYDIKKGHAKKATIQDVKGLQEKYRLGDAWLYRTKRGFHVYFFCDEVVWPVFKDLVQNSQCCKGFKSFTERNGHAVLRVSAKYTAFDIQFDGIIRSPVQEGRRMARKALIARSLLDLGAECGTHFASLFPQWAPFKEDEKEWKQQAKKGGQSKHMRDWKLSEIDPLPNRPVSVRNTAAQATDGPEPPGERVYKRLRIRRNTPAPTRMPLSVEEQLQELRYVPPMPPTPPYNQPDPTEYVMPSTQPVQTYTFAPYVRQPPINTASENSAVIFVEQLSAEENDEESGG